MKFLIMSFIVCIGMTAYGVEEVYQFDTDEQRQRFSELTFELRCPKCQNQNIADSNAPIAEDLRGEVSRLIKEGKDNEAVVQFMVDRYGEFVLYEPRFNVKTSFIWLVPAVLLLIGLVVLVSVSRSRKQVHESKELDSKERERLAQLLAASEETVSEEVVNDKAIRGKVSGDK